MSIEVLLAILVVLVAANLTGLVMLWIHIDRRGNDIKGMEGRITRLESGALTSAQVLSLHERLAGLERVMDANTMHLKTIQEHLLENDP